MRIFFVEMTLNDGSVIFERINNMFGFVFDIVSTVLHHHIIRSERTREQLDDGSTFYITPKSSWWTHSVNDFFFCSARNCAVHFLWTPLRR